MSTADVILLLAWAAMCNVWGVLLWMQFRLRRDGTVIAPTCADDDAEVSSVAVIVPARNEAAAIGDCLDSVVTQDLETMRVIVVDDRSEDETGRIVDGYSRSDPRVTGLRVDELPPGWLGKSHALWRATRGIESDWLLFLDADCRLLSPGALRAAIGEAKRRDASLLTLWPRHGAGGFWEALLIPLCGAIMALWYGRSNTPSASAFANGQFLLMRRAAYEAVGGHESVRRAVIEDVPLAELTRRAGFTTWAGGGGELVSVRMYDSLAGVYRGWSRIFVGALRSPLKIAASMAWLLAGSAWPLVAAPLLALAWWHLDGPAPTSLVPMTALCATHLLLLFLVSYRFWGLGHCDHRHLWLYPLSVIGVLVILIDAWWTMTIRRRIGWRTTSYRFDRRAMIVDSALENAG